MLLLVHLPAPLCRNVVGTWWRELHVALAKTSARHRYQRISHMKKHSTAALTLCRYETMAQAMIDSGMVAAGYTLMSTVCTDWLGRDPVTHDIQQNLTLWPGGMKSFSAWLHERGMQLSVCVCHRADMRALTIIVNHNQCHSITPEFRTQNMPCVQY
jgi:hypothetical protein